METVTTKDEYNLVRAAVQAKIAYWDALRALEIALGDNLSDRQESKMTDLLDALATSVPCAAAIEDENAQEVLNEISQA